MQTRIRFFDDIAKVSLSLVGLVVGIKDEIKQKSNHRRTQDLKDMDFVSPEEFEVVKAMATKARAQADALEKRVKELEGKSSRKPAQKKP